MLTSNLAKRTTDFEYFDSLSKLESFTDETAETVTVFEINKSGAINSGSLKRGLFSYEVNFFNDAVLHRIEDFIRYENSHARIPVILDEAGLCPSLGGLSSSRTIEGLRKYEPKICVHSTSLENGIKILEEGRLKSQLKLIEEGWFVDTQLGYTLNGEPEGYLNHINLGGLASPWPERVSQSNQIQEIGNWNTPYQPGLRFYFSTKKLEAAGLLLRTGAPFIKVAGSLCLDESNGYLGVISSADLEGGDWLPDEFTRKANELFRQKFS